MEAMEQNTSLSEENAEMQNAAVEEFNVFRLCGIGRDETVHSRILAEILNPKDDGVFLEDFLERVDCWLEELDYDTVQVYTGYATDEGPIDILIEDNQGNAMIIRNEMNAAEDSRQILERYGRFAQKRYAEGHYKILYLTLRGEEAPGFDCMPISYQEHIIDWVSRLAFATQEYVSISATLDQYRDYLQQLTVKGR